MYDMLCREKKCETLREEGKLIKGIANGPGGEQGTACFCGAHSVPSSEDQRTDWWDLNPESW